MKRSLLTLIVSFYVLALNAEIYNGYCGAEGDSTNLQWSFNIEDSTLTITGSGAMADYTNSNSVPWYNYKVIILDVSISDGVTNIGDYAFSHCGLLTSIDIPNSVTSIGRYAFYWCSALNSVTIPNGVISIEEWTFSYCNDLTSIMMPNSVTIIGERAFYDCGSLASIEISNSVNSIGPNAFSGCSRLTSIELPNSVTSIGKYAFRNCDKLSTIYCLAEIPPTLGGLLEIDGDTLFVPNDAVDTYINSDWANEFTNILPIHFGESEVIDIEETTANILWEPEEGVEKYKIEVFTAGTLFAEFIVDSNEQVISQQYYAPLLRQALTKQIHLMPQDTTISGTDYYVISLGGLSAGTQYSYTIQGYISMPDLRPEAMPGAKVEEIVYYGSGNFKTKAVGQLLPTAMPALWEDQWSSGERKLYLIDGKVVIGRDGKAYDLMGRRINGK